MPRIIDLLDAAVGHTPDVLDRKVDYLAQRAPPERVVGEDGTYTPGWFTAAPEVLNFEDSSAFEMAFQRWFHFTLDCPEHFIIFNVADFTRATNTAILVANKQTGTFDHSSLTRLLVGGVEVSEDQRHFTDRDSQSVIAVSPDDRQFRFSVHAENLHLTGVAEHTLGPPMIQCTGFHRGRGSLQWYGCVRLRFGVLTIGDTVIELPPCYGTYDRTMGHQRGLQGWNWIAMVSSHS